MGLLDDISAVEPSVLHFRLEVEVFRLQTREAGIELLDGFIVITGELYHF